MKEAEPPKIIVFGDQIAYERHLFAEHNRLRDPIAAVIGDE